MYEQDNKMYNTNYDCECSNKNKKKVKNCCIDLTIFVLGVLFALALGLTIGSIPDVATTLYNSIAALIILAIVLFVLVVIRIIENICDKCCKKSC